MTDNLERALQERLLARSQVSPRDVEALRLFARTLPAKRSAWRMPALRWGLTAAAVVLAAVVALPPLLNNLPGFGSEPSPTPTAPATPAPSQPAPTPTVPAPTVAPSLGADIVRLLTASGSEVIVRISDPDGLLTGARAEQAEATMSIRWFEAIVEDAPPSGIRLTWVGFARDEELQLEVSRDGSGGLLVHIVQNAPPPASDGEGEDRILVLELDEAVDPADVEVTFDYPA
jgi:hypothetical protein